MELSFYEYWHQNTPKTSEVASALQWSENWIFRTLILVSRKLLQKWSSLVFVLFFPDEMLIIWLPFLKDGKQPQPQHQAWEGHSNSMPAGLILLIPSLDLRRTPGPCNFSSCFIDQISHFWLYKYRRLRWKKWLSHTVKAEADTEFTNSSVYECGNMGRFSNLPLSMGTTAAAF